MSPENQLPPDRSDDEYSRKSIEVAGVKIPYIEFLNRLEAKLLRGVTNQNQLSAAFQVKQPHISTAIKDIRARWRERTEESLEDMRMNRIHQIENIALLALNSYEASRDIKTEHTVVEKVCSVCDGLGTDEDKPGEVEKCRRCDGSGVEVQSTMKKTGQAGDASHLRLAKECFVEAAKIEGSIPLSSGAGKLTMLRTGVGVEDNGELKRSVEGYHLEAPVDQLMAAMSVLDDLKNGVKVGSQQYLAAHTERQRQGKKKAKEVDSKAEKPKKSKKPKNSVDEASPGEWDFGEEESSE